MSLINDEVVFNPDTHTYWSGNTELKSVTRWYNERFIKPFDTVNAAIGKLKSEKNKGENKYNQASGYMLDWSLNGKLASARGTATHAFAEYYLYKVTNGQYLKPTNLLEENAERAIKHLLSLYDLVGSEEMVFSKTYKLAGTYDTKWISKSTGKTIKTDWKTVDVLTEDEYKEAGKSVNKMLNEMSDYKDYAIYKYSIQLSIYNILDNSDDECYIVRIPSKRVFNPIDDIIPIINFKDRIKSILDANASTTDLIYGII